MNVNHGFKKQRILLWLSVIAYTFSLPYVIVIYESITLRWSPEIAGLIPRIILLAGSVAYVFYSLRVGLSLRRIFLLLSCGIIAFLIVCLEPNPNKHIHIPEYILMAWLLFEVLQIDYRGAGIYLLVFLCSSLLGVLDEILQGIHASRFFGWQDMLLNSLSALIGILSLMGLREKQEDGWGWAYQFNNMRVSLMVVFVGMFTTAVNCYVLFDVQRHSGSWYVYPDWLIIWSVVFEAIAFVALCRIFREDAGKFHDQEITARLWVSVPLVIIMIIHMVIIFCRQADTTFL